jgi:S1-C subfamily serine protease
MSHDQALGIVRQAEYARIDAMARAAPSVVCIFDENKAGGGSGVVITEDGYGLTNFHVVAGMMKSREGLGGMADGNLYKLEVLGIDPTGDAAMFKLSGREKFTPAPLGNSESVAVGDWVFAMGNPFMMADDYTPTVTHGIVSGVHRYQFGSNNRFLVYTDCIQVDASINPGNSGGPLFDMNAELIGINGRASFEHRGRVNVGAGYAISTSQLKRFIPGLRAGLLTEHGSLGATVVDLGYQRVVFEKMLEPSVASSVGIHVGDRLVAFDGRDIHSANDFANMLNVYPAFWPVDVTFEHDGENITRRVRLERLTVPMEQPFEVNEDINRRETRRVLEPCLAALGQWPAGKRLTWRGERIATTIVDGQENGETLELEGLETAPGRQTVTLRQVPSGRQEILICSGRTVTIEQADGAEAEADPIVRDQLNLWPVAREALYHPSEEDAERWSHQGADSWWSDVIDRLEFNSRAGRDFFISIDPATHLPVRAIWQPIDVPSEDNPLIEIVFDHYRSVDGVMLPHTVRTFVNGRRVAEDTIREYKWEASDAGS